MADQRPTRPPPIPADRVPRPRELTRPGKPAPPGPGNRLPIVREEVAESTREGQRLWQHADTLDEANAAAREAQRERDEERRRAERAEAALTRERRKSAPRVDSVAPALVIDKRGAYVPRWIAVLLLPALGGAWGAWDNFKAQGRRIEALEAAELERAKKATEAAPSEKAKQERIDRFNRGVVAWLERLASQQQIEARKAKSAEDVDPVQLAPVQMPDRNRVKPGPLWRAEQELPEPP